MIEALNLTKYYGNRKALDAVSFTVHDGEVVGLLGLNGAGKSTTMNIITGCLSTSAGKALINGIDIAEESEKAKLQIGYLPEIPPLYTDMKVFEYLGFVYELKKAKQPFRDHLQDIYSKTGTENVWKRLIKNLSKGYRQRVGLAQAILHQPKVLLLDEPASGLDPNQTEEINRLLLSLSREKGILFSSHTLPEVSTICTRILFIHRGEIVADLPKDEIEDLDVLFKELTK
jgi:ABC-2 type transport system ATP-binding protein